MALRRLLVPAQLQELLDALRRTPAGLDPALARSVAFGVAFHHAGTWPGGGGSPVPRGKEETTVRGCLDTESHRLDGEGRIGPGVTRGEPGGRDATGRKPWFPELSEFP